MRLLNEGVRAVIFDFDGLMIDSETVALEIWQRYVSRFGKDLTSDLYRPMIGRSPQGGASYVRDLFDLPKSSDEVLIEYWQERTEEMVHRGQPMPGLQELTRFLEDRTIPLGVASNSPAVYVEKTLDALGYLDMMSCVVSSDQVANGKPAPDVYLACAACLDLEPSVCVAIEDSPTGLRAAVEAGMQCLVVPNATLRDEDYSSAWRRFEDLFEVREFLGG